MFVLHGSVRARILQANMRMRNGMLHIIDRVLYTDDPNSAEFRASTAVTPFPNPVIIILLLTASSLAAKLTS